MNKHEYLPGLVFACLCISNTLNAGTVEEACNSARVQLGTVTGGQLEEKEGEFVHGDKRYKGCIFMLKGDNKTITVDYSPADLFYPFRDSASFREGWLADSEADGPDGSSFRIHKSGSFCLIEWRRDGGDDSDPAYVPSSVFSITVKCAAMKN